MADENDRCDTTDRRVEKALRESEEAERLFSEQLTTLHEVSNELSKAPSLDELCRRAVELGRSRLGFDRMGIWFVGEDRRTATGSFGVDESGCLRDERGSRVTVTPQSVAGQVLASKRPCVCRRGARVLDNRAQVVGRASHAIAALWDGEEVIGFVSSDNLLSRQPMTERHCKLLTLYASTLGHLVHRKRLEEELERRVEALAEADRRKDEFLAMLAHELRNPLGAISSSLYVMQLPNASEATRQRALDVLKRQVQHQVRIVDDLLEVSRITRGRVELREERLDPAKLVHDAADDCRLALEEAGLALLLELPDEPLWVNGDATRLTQVIGNLLSNAMKFTAPGGSVTVRVSRLAATPICDGHPVPGGVRPDLPDPANDAQPMHDGGHETHDAVAVTVSDTGIGISPELLGSVFDTFTQGDRSLDRSRGGLGLGLALVKGLVQLHRGQVHAHSDGLGTGASFTFELPLAASPASPAARPEAHDDGRGTRDAGRRVLIVDDNRDAAGTLRDLLELAGHSVETAHSGPAGLEAARRMRPDVVLCDIGLPGMDGYAVAAALRRDPATASARLIAVTGYGQDEDRRHSRTAGFDHHLVKPIDPAELERLLAGAPSDRSG